jgi:iron(III) transport system ATP-binding protein
VSGSSVRAEGVRLSHAGAERPALDGVDLEAPAGRILVLLGASGAGKTTLLRVLAGLETPEEGRVLVGERVVSDPRPRVAPERRGIGFVFQHLELWPHMTVAEHVAFGLPGRPRGRRAAGHATVRSLAERVGIAPLLSRRPPTLSGGERQRVAIARALAPAPSALLYDEPLANLDPDRRAAVRSLIRGLSREQGTTLVYVTHDPAEALEVGDHVAVMAQGRVIEHGTPEVLYRAPRTLGGARALGPVTVLPGLVEGLRIRTALGLLDLVAPAPEGADAAALRAEDLAVGEAGTEATVVDSRPAGLDWSVAAEAEGVALLARSERRLEPGERVRVAVRRPVAAVRRDA